ncbi:MAG TPA: hypothetical protein VNW28_09105 [Chthoniobacterales bacterium]|nr:hypothetical protein [Chthoniobacterales bacterium]
MNASSSTERTSHDSGMNLADLANLGQVVGAIGVIITLVYLALQIRGSTKVASAQARHSLSEFILRISIFRAEHADRFAKLESGVELTAGDRYFQYWSHVQLLLHAETYFHHHELGLMPHTHWRGYARYMSGYVGSAGFREVWDDIGPSFSEDFARWLNGLIASHSSA